MIKRIVKILIIAFFVISLLLLSFILINTALGYKPYRIVSASMSPSISEGDIVYAKSVPFNKLKENDIIVFGYNNSNMIVTHRIISVNISEGYAVAKGDKNKSVEAKIYADDIIGKYIYKIPLIGKIL